MDGRGLRLEVRGDRQKTIDDGRGTRDGKGWRGEAIGVREKE
jgi:hypothetical protein